MKPKNFPERKRVRQIGALWRGPLDPDEEETLAAAIHAGDQSHVRTKKPDSPLRALARMRQRGAA